MVAKLMNLVNKVEVIIHTTIDTATAALAKVNSIEKLCVVGLIATVTLELVFTKSSGIISYVFETIAKVGIPGAILVVVLYLVYKEHSKG